jgi:hypothetical protein
VLLLLNRFVPLALFVIAPIVLNILLFHFFMDPGGIPRSLFVLVLWVLAALRFPDMFLVLFRAKPSEAECALSVLNTAGDFTSLRRSKNYLIALDEAYSETSKR